MVACGACGAPTGARAGGRLGGRVRDFVSDAGSPRSCPVGPDAPGQAGVTAHDPTGRKVPWRAVAVSGLGQARWSHAKPSAGGRWSSLQQVPGPEGTWQPLPGHLLHGAGVCKRVCRRQAGCVCERQSGCWLRAPGPRGWAGSFPRPRSVLAVSGLLVRPPPFYFMSCSRRAGHIRGEVSSLG